MRFEKYTLISFPHLCVSITYVYHAVIPEGGDNLSIIHPSIFHHRLSCSQGRGGAGAYPSYLDR